MTTADEHRRLREMLGAHALGDLPADLGPGLRAHLDGCAACRAELAEIAPLRERLRGVDVDALSDTPVPPPDLGERIRARVAQERVLTDRRARSASAGRRVLAAAADVVLLAGAVGVGAVVGRSTAPTTPTAQPSSAPLPSAQPPSAQPLPLEEVALEAGFGVSARTATAVAHTWGVEARFTGTGFAAGRTYRAAFRADDGRLLPAGEFLGTGERELRCAMQSALLRADTAGFVVTDDAGATVLTATL